MTIKNSRRRKKRRRVTALNGLKYSARWYQKHHGKVPERIKREMAILEKRIEAG